MVRAAPGARGYVQRRSRVAPEGRSDRDSVWFRRSTAGSNVSGSVALRVPWAPEPPWWASRQAALAGRIPDFPEQCVGKDGL